MSERLTVRIGTYRPDETEMDLLQMSGEETDWSYTPVPTLSKALIAFPFNIVVALPTALQLF
jgi:hypothetical protein